MTSLRLSVGFLVLAAVLASVAFGLVDALPPVLWSTIRMLCLGALLAFVVTFLIGLDRSALVRR